MYPATVARPRTEDGPPGRAKGPPRRGDGRVTTAHRMTVLRKGPQRFTMRCSCGHEGRNSKGEDFWNKAGGLNAAFVHADALGIEKQMPDYIDLEPASRRSGTRRAATPERPKQ
jgi:hypothetical protein